MRKFSDLYEAPQTLVFAFGRFNPPTTGHEKLIKKVASVAGSNPYRIYPSFTTNPKKDPLPHALKVAYMRKMFPKHKKNIIADTKMKTAIFIAEAVYKEGFKNLIMVVGSDRVKEFSELLTRYNDAPDKSGNQLFKFDSVKVVSAGERDPDSEGVDGMSASKMRTAAADGDKDAFLTGVPSNFKDGEKLYRDVRKYMGIREERDMGDMSDFENVRDMYLTGKIWNAGDIVEAKGVTGEVVRKGTNYLSFVDEDGKVHKAWLHEIESTDYIVEGLSMMVKDPKTKKKMQLAAAQKIQFNGSNYETEGVTKKQVLVMKDGRKEVVMTKKQIEDSLKDGSLKVTDFGKVYQPEEIELDERNYKKEYANYQGKPEQIERRSSRNKARRIMGDKTKIGMDVGHKDNDPLNNDPKNLRNEDPSKNRREPRLREMDEDVYDTFPWLRKAKDYLFTKTHKKGMNKVALKIATEFAKQQKAGKNPNPINIIHDVSKGIIGVTDRMVVTYINDLVKQGKLPKDLRAEFEPVNETMSFKSFVDSIQEVKQDKDIDDKKGTQPAKYYAGDMAKSTKDKRDAHFRKKKSGPAPGDADAKTKPSVHTKKFKQMYGEQKKDCPPATKDVALNTKNRNATRKNHMYGPLNIKEPSDYWEKLANKWNTTVKAAKKSTCGSCVAFDISPRMEECLPGSVSDDSGRLGYCWMHHFKCHSARSCDTWATGGPIKEDKKSYEWQEKAFGKSEKLSKNADQGDYIDDFEKSDAPQFKGKSKEKRKDMAIAAYLSKNEDAPCWDTHKQVGMKKKSGRMVPNCVPKNEEPRIPRKKGQPAGSDKHSDLYTDENPVGTIQGLGFKDVDTAKASVKKIIGSGKTHAHKIQAAIAMEQRAKEMGKTSEASVFRTYIDKMKKKTKEMQEEVKLNEWGEVTEKDDKSGKELNNPTKGDVKKYKVYVKNDKGNVVKVEFGDPNMQIKRDDPARRKAFRARHNCDQKKDKTTAGYWSCKFWSGKSVTDLMKG